MSLSITEQVAQATSLRPRDISFNTNFNLPDGLGTKDVDIHLSGELLAQRAEAELREQYGNVPQSVINTIRDRINYSVRADQGKEENKVPPHQARMKAIKDAQKQATAIAQAEAQGITISQADAIAIQEPQAIIQSQAQKQADGVSMAQAYRNALQQELSQAMAYNDISVDTFFP